LSWLTEVQRVLWLAVPVLVAAAVQILFIKKKWLARLATPLDGGRTFRGVRWFGDNKTWRGLLIYVVVSTLAVIPQGIWRLPGIEYDGLDYATWQGLLPIGFLLGLGFALGELPNSFLKRRRGIGAGERGGPVYVLLDQVDSLVGCLACLCVLWVPPWQTWAVVLALGTGLHIGFNGIFVLLGLKKSVF
jgi:hypothetical protein